MNGFIPTIRQCGKKPPQKLYVVIDYSCNFAVAFIERSDPLCLSRENMSIALPVTGCLADWRLFGALDYRSLTIFGSIVIMRNEHDLYFAAGPYEGDNKIL